MYSRFSHAKQMSRSIPICTSFLGEMKKSDLLTRFDFSEFCMMSANYALASSARIASMVAL